MILCMCFAKSRHRVENTSSKKHHRVENTSCVTCVFHSYSICMSFWVEIGKVFEKSGGTSGASGENERSE